MEFDIATFKLKPSRDSDFQLLNNKFVVTIIEKILGLAQLRYIYSKISHTQTAIEFTESFLNIIKVSLDYDIAALNNIPRTGPVIVVGNHPSNIDGFLLGLLLSHVRSDFKILGNYLYQHIPQLRPVTIPVDPFFKNKKIKKRNLTGMKTAIQFLHQGGILGIFPAGTVSLFHFKKRCITDSPWHATIGSLIQHAKVPIVPVYFSLTNTFLYQVLGTIHRYLPNVLLLAEFYNKQNRKAPIQIGKLIPYNKLSTLNNIATIHFLQETTYNLGKE